MLALFFPSSLVNIVQIRTVVYTYVKKYSCGITEREIVKCTVGTSFASFG